MDGAGANACSLEHHDGTRHDDRAAQDLGPGGGRAPAATRSAPTGRFLVEATLLVRESGADDARRGCRRSRRGGSAVLHRRSASIAVVGGGMVAGSRVNRVEPRRGRIAARCDDATERIAAGEDAERRAVLASRTTARPAAPASGTRRWRWRPATTSRACDRERRPDELAHEPRSSLPLVPAAIRRVRFVSMMTVSAGPR